MNNIYFFDENNISKESTTEYKKGICQECSLLKEQIINLNKLIRSYEKQIELLEEKYECNHNKKKAG